MTESLVALIVSYRDSYSEYPFLPWLHSTEPIEHVFGVLRQLKPDFNFSDFLSFIPKLCTFLLGKFGLMSVDERSNLMASGYWHTYLHTDDIDLEALVAWPTDSEIEEASRQALEETHDVLALVGIDTRAMLAVAPKRRKRAVPAERTRAVKPRSCPSLMRLSSSLLNEYLEDEAVDSLQDLYRRREELGLQDAKVDAELDAKMAALVATEAQLSESIEDLPDTQDPDHTNCSRTISEFVSASRTIATTASIARKKLMCAPLPPQLRLAGSLAEQLSQLVADRARVQNSFTSTALRKGAKTTSTAPKDFTEAQELQHALAAGLRKLMGTVQVKNTAGYARQVRWTAASTGAESSMGNEQYQRARRLGFEKLGREHPNILTAGITSRAPLDLRDPDGGYALILVPVKGKKKPELVLGQVIAMYTKMSRRHAPIEVAHSLDEISYVGVQVFRPFRGFLEFSSNACPALGSASFIHISPANLVLSLHGFSISRDTRGASLSTVDFLSPETACSEVIRVLSDKAKQIAAAVKATKTAVTVARQARRQGDASGSSSDGDDDLADED
ncbi:hypothetical protein AURDEDRAFT_175567 [Auricularia subglabra TFB-10046 SS5]|uniref:Uncharacterized protein n=1 Tax=Auricularia subglabra (strain TFB-10046 / SS5) TaxID=717982 RepID=J0CXA3_AURST|nr:hypothetical protein AURDEDRAFT_175567 [Auricularia subglabra TFB-10046 SS5]